MVRKDYPFSRRIQKQGTKYVSNFWTFILNLPLTLFDSIIHDNNQKLVKENKRKQNSNYKKLLQECNIEPKHCKKEKDLKLEKAKLELKEKRKKSIKNFQNNNCLKQNNVADSSIKLSEHQKKLCSLYIKTGANPNIKITLKSPQIGSNVIRKNDKKVLIVIGHTKKLNYICLDLDTQKCDVYTKNDLILK